MKKFMYLLGITLFMLSVTQQVAADVPRKKSKSKAKVTEAKKDSLATHPYHKLLKKGSVKTVKSNFITLHKLDQKVYFEIPLKYFGREMLLASTLSETSDVMFGDVGYKQNAPLHVRFTLGDSVVYLMNVNSDAITDPGNSQQKAIDRSFSDAILFKNKVEAYNPERTAVVVDMTDLFMTDLKEFSFLPRMGMLNVKGDFKRELSGLDQIKSFDDNLSVSSYMTYKVSISLWILTLLDNVKVTGKVNRSFLLLPENKMRPRIADRRVGIFLTDKQHISNREDGIREYSFASRWRLEPKDKEAYRRGELVEPIKPIVYYVDDAFPEEWRQPVKEAVLSWNAAFEKIGFKNVMQVRDFPKNDSTFDPDNLKYSCIRYLPSTTANAMGPSWVDPRTGEIINASVIIYNDVIRLVNNWRFVQTAQVDPRVRAKKLPDDLMRESMVYVVAHEVGHTLGFMHNMGASAAFPVDSLRSASFTQQYGITPTIMDYARFNYVAQPQDKGVRLNSLPLGIYDYFLVKWNYQPVFEARDEWEEQKIIEKWVDEKAGDPYFRYGRQQIFCRYDPSSIEEDLGDDPIKAGDYGVKNLKYILANLEQWIENDADYAHREELYNSIGNQYFRYINNVMMNIGGIYLNEVKEGTPGQKYRAVPKNVQKASLKWVLKEFRNSDWLSNTPLKKQFTLKVDLSNVLKNKLASSMPKLVENVALSAHIAENPYGIGEFLTDLYNGIFENTIRGRKLTEGDKILQNVMVNTIIAPLEDKKSGGLFGLTNAYAPSVDEILVYNLEDAGLIRRYEHIFRQIENEYGNGYVAAHLRTDAFGSGYGFLQKIAVNNIDDSEMYLIDLVYKAHKLITTKVATALGTDRIHYQALLAKMNKVLKK